MRGEQLRLFTPDDDSNIKNRRRLIIIPLDTFILSSVVIILLFILAFSLGVERGRKIYYANLDKENLEKNLVMEDEQPVKAQPKTASLPLEVKKEVSKPVAAANTPRVIQPQARTETVTATIVPKPEIGGSYSIQLASYNKESFAQAEAKVLQAKGFPAFVLKKTDYVVLYAGPFKTKPEADKNMGLLKKTYKDCILRRL